MTRHSRRLRNLSRQLEKLENRYLLAAAEEIAKDWFGAGPVATPYLENTALVRIAANTQKSATELFSGLGGSISQTPISNLWQISFATDEQVQEAIRNLQDAPDIEYATLMELVSGAYIPNDPSFNNLWGMNNVGQTGGTTDADIDAPEAWNLVQGAMNVVIADIDSGIDYSHPDLYKNIWINQSEIPTSRLVNLTDIDSDGLITFWDLNDPVNIGFGKITDFNSNSIIDGGDLLWPALWEDGNDSGYGGWANGISEDGDIYVDDVIGWDFRNGDNDPYDDHGHGTHTTGTIAAVGDNGVGVAGVLWKTQVMPLKFLGADNFGTYLNGARAIAYAAAKGAQISNNSWGGTSADPVLKDAIEDVEAAGHLLVAAAGNGGNNIDDWPQFYPASYPDNNILTVTATNHSDTRFYNYGSISVDLAAPGVAIYSTLPNGGYASWNGTSMAAPHVTGTAAALWSLRPSLNYVDVKARLMATVDKLPNFNLTTVAGGRLNFYRAVSGSPPTNILLSNNSIAENQPLGTAIGTLSSVDDDLEDTFVYTLVSGEGSTDNGSFQIAGDSLLTNGTFDYETKNSFSIRVKTTDSAGLTFEKMFTVLITDINEAPTLIDLSSNSVAENQAAGTEIGTLSTTDVDAGDSFTYGLVSGIGSTDNAAFAIDGASLKTTESFNFEGKNGYSVRVRSTDSGGLTTERAFTISVTNVNDAPTTIALSPSAIPENQPSGTLVGDLSTTDEDAGDTFTYSLVTGEGAGDNDSFTIVGEKVYSSASFNFEAKDTYTIRVRSEDAGDFATEKILTIQVTDVNETPTALDLSNKSIVEKEPVGAIVGNLITTDPDNGDQFTYSLVTGEGSEDNARFSIDGGALKSAQIFDFIPNLSYKVRIRSTDSGGLFTEQAFTIAISDVRIGGFDTALAVTYKENAAPLSIASVGTVADKQLLNFDGGTLTASLSANGTADDRLTVKNVGVSSGQISVVDGNKVYITKKISGVLTPVQIGTFAGGVGTNPLVITFNANAFRAEVQAALRAITFKVESETPSAAARTASFVITDGDGGISNTATRTINVLPVNDKPVISVSPTSVNFQENGASVLVDEGVTVIDVDSLDFAGGKLTVKSVSGGQTTDRYGIEPSLLVALNTAVTPAQVLYSGNVVGTYAGTTTLTVTFNASATANVVQEVARRIKFWNASDAVTTGQRNVSYSVSDGDGGTSLAALGDFVNVTGFNDKPVLTLNDVTPAKYTENGAPLLIAASGTVADVDLLNFDTGVLTVAIEVGGDPHDVLTVKHTDPASGKVSVEGNILRYTNSLLVTYDIATFTGGDVNNPLSITFNANALRTEVQAVMRAVTFETATDSPTTDTRMISFSLSDGDGATSDVVFRTVNVVAVNDKPTISGFEGAVDYVKGNLPTLLTDSTSITDLDSPHFNGGKLTLALTTGKATGDLLSISEGDGIQIAEGGIVTYNNLVIGSIAGTATSLTINFTTTDATVAAVEALLKRIGFSTTAASTSVRTVTASVTDNTGVSSTTVSKSINVLN